MIKKNYSGGSLANTVISWSKSFETKDIVGGSIQTTNYFFANNELVAMKKPDNSMRYFHSDHLGSTTVITDQSGNLVEETEFGPWGEVIDGGTESKYQFTGQEKDSETGLNYMNARYYSADLKRFTQPDTIVQDPYDPQMLNRYAYARNNPLRYTDPSGNVVSCNKNGCSSSYLPTPKPKAPPTTYQQFTNNIPKPSPQNQPSKQSTSNNGGSSSGGGNTNNNPIAAVAGVVGAAAGSLARQNYINGYAFQNAVNVANGFVKNTQGLGAAYGNRIPDILDHEQKIIGECKAVGYICNTQQLKDMIRFAGDNGYKFTLYNNGGNLSQPIQDSINDLKNAGTGAVGSMIPFAVGASTAAPAALDAVPLFINTGIIYPYYSNYENSQQI
jgi:RHS repeat-associated protein